MSSIDQDNQRWNDLQNMYEMGLIGRTEYEKQRDLLLTGELSSTSTDVTQEETSKEIKEEVKPVKPAVPEEEFIEGVTETPVDANGMKIITEFKLNESGRRVKVVRVVKVVKQQTKVKKSVLERRKIAKFGACKGKAAGPEPGVTTIGDLVALEVPQEEKKPEKKEATKNYAVSCRNCGAIGDHWTVQCPYKDRILNVDNLLGGEDSGKDKDGKGEGLSSGKPGKYRPPGAREGGGSSMPDDRSKEQSSTIRVTNLSDDTTELDVRDLFSKFGAVQRVYLARNKATQQSRGFAFVSFYVRKEAEKAMETLQGFGYDNLILRLEWAAPSRN